MWVGVLAFHAPLRSVDPNNKEQMSLLEEMKQHTKELERLRSTEVRRGLGRGRACSSSRGRVFCCRR